MDFGETDWYDRLVRNFTKLHVWQKAHALTLDIYRTTELFPREERYELTRQIRRSASSVPTNIAEGSGRRSHVDFARFLDIALGSTSETTYHLILARDLGILDETDYDHLADRARELRMMLTSLARTLRSGEET